MRIENRIKATILTIAALACGSDSSSTSSAVVRDSAGVRIVENLDAAPEFGWHLSAEPAIDIGGEDAGDDYQLFRVVSALRLSDGQIVVANSRSSELRFYGADGTFVGSAGRRGDGPGEFQSLSRMHHMPGDSLITYDSRLRRLSIFGSDGSFARSFRLEITDDVPFASILYMYADGSLLAHGFANTGNITPNGLQRYDAPLYHFAPDGMFLTDLGMFPGRETYYKAFEGGFSFYEAFFPRETYRVTAGMHLYVAQNDSYEIRRYSPDGMLTGLVRRAHSPVAVTNAHVRQERERRLAQANSDDRQSLSKVLDEIPVPSIFPAYGWVRVDDELNLWVQEYSLPRITNEMWAVFDSSGVLLGGVKLPQGLDPKHISSDFVLGVWRDELDVEHVRLYELEKP